ncbi:MAG: endonuclease/exonuclease/phosphatase family protein [Anaerolineales bacterium]
MPVQRIKLGSYNVNNFFDRFDDPYNWADDRWGARRTKPKSLSDIFSVGARLREDAPDVLALQEVENKGTLYEFNVVQLGGHFKDEVVIEGNDPRGIQLGLASTLPLGQVVSYQFLRDFGDSRRGKIFSRDLLEVEILDPETFVPVLTVFNAHLKSKYIDPSLRGAERLEEQQRSDHRRTRQAMAMAQIIQRRFPNPRRAFFAVMGDFNDTPDSAALAPLLNNPQLGLFDVLTTLPENRRWTHYWSEQKQRSQIDYILLSEPLRQRMVEGSAHVVHRGHTTGSDHHPLYVDIWVGWD